MVYQFSIAALYQFTTAADKCSLFGLGWLAIDECGGKLEMRPTTCPLNNWLDPIQAKIKAPSTARVPKPIKNTDLGTPHVLDG